MVRGRLSCLDGRSRLGTSECGRLVRLEVDWKVSGRLEMDMRESCDGGG
jgi:hypothetical protein